MRHSLLLRRSSARVCGGDLSKKRMLSCRLCKARLLSHVRPYLPRSLLRKLQFALHVLTSKKSPSYIAGRRRPCFQSLGSLVGVQRPSPPPPFPSLRPSKLEETDALNLEPLGVVALLVERLEARNDFAEGRVPLGQFLVDGGRRRTELAVKVFAVRARLHRELFGETPRVYSLVQQPDLPNSTTRRDLRQRWA